MAENKNKRVLYRLIYAIDGVPCYAELVPKGARLCGLARPTRPNSTFDGWGEVPARMPAHDLTLDGHFTTNIYRVLFASGVEQYGMAEMPAGRPLTPPPAPVREGFDFAGWEGFDGTMPSENRTFEAIFVPRTYRVTYLVDDTYRLNLRCSFGQPFPRLPEPRKSNHVFSGWSEMPKTMPAGDVTVTGHFTETLYKLTRTVDNTVFSEEYLPFGAPVDKKIKPVQEGYYFSGWRKLPDTMPARDVVVAASMYPARYRVDFYLNDTLTDSVYVPFGEPIPVHNPPEQSGMLFGGWDNLPETMPAHDIAVRGSMTPTLFRLSYAVDGEEIWRTDLAEGEPLPKDVEVPSKEGFAFCGWENAPTSMPAHDLTLNGVYAAVKSRYLFLIDGKKFAEINPEEGEQLVMPTPPPRDGQPFGGWGSMKSDPRTGVITFSGSYAGTVTYLLTYLLHGEEVYREHLPAAAPITPFTPPAREEYEFLGWENLPAVMPACDVTVVGNIRELKYTLEFAVEGQILYSMALDAGAEISCPALAPRVGYTFSGWKNVPAVMPAHNLTIEGGYRPNAHTVTYMLEGKEIYSATMHYGDTLVAPDIPEEESNGRVFVGWSPDITAMPDADTVIEGAFSDTVCLVDVYVDGLRTDTLRAMVGMPLALPDYPAAEGMRFVWQNVPAVVPPGRMEVHGGYVKNLYTVTYLTGGIVVGEERYCFGDAITPHVKLPEEGAATFLGWRDLPATMPACNLSVQAEYADRTYHITFQLDGRVLYESDVPVGAATPHPQVPEKEGYRFDGWRNYVEVMPPYNFTAYGSYSRRTYRVSYLCGEDVVEEQEYVSGAPIVAPAPPRRKHHVFRGWEGLPTNMPAHDLTVSARYRGEKFRISYVIDGNLVSTEDLEFGTRIKPFVPAEREGMVFAGWHSLPTFMPDREVIVTGNYETCAHTVTYKVNGMIYRIDTYEAGEKIVPPAPPEHEYESFVRWRNLAAVMPDYDFTCVAEYSEIFGHYAFVLDGEILAEGSARKGEMLTPPEAPHRSGFAFSGWEGFTGVMPANDVVYIGSYVTDVFKVMYYLDGNLYHEDGYNEGERVSPVDAPEVEGYTFSGWQGLPNVMPSDDVTVTGKMLPISYRLMYRTDAALAVFDKKIPCGTKLGHVTAPERFGYEFCGWSEEPSVMPPYPVTVRGNYRFSEEQYKTAEMEPGAHVTEKCTVKKAPPREPRALAFLNGDYLRLVVDDICYPVPGSGACLRNSRVTDEDGLASALRHLWRKYRLPKKIKLVLGDSARTDVIRELPREGSLMNGTEPGELFGDGGFGTEAAYHTVTLCEYPGGRRAMVSMYHAPTADALIRAFGQCGVTVTETRTLMGALTEYLQQNRKMERGKNQICLFYLPNSVLGVLMLDGQVTYMSQNAYPFDGRSWDVPRETGKILGQLAREAERRLVTSRVSIIAVGGIDRTHVRTAEKCVVTQLRDIIGSSVGNLFGGSRDWKRPSVVHLGFAHTENRTK